MFAGLAISGRAAADPPASGPARTIVVFGDSQAQGVAAGLRRLYVRDRNYRIVDKTVPGTSLSQKLQYDWVGTIDAWLAGDHADIAIVMFGGNDRLAVRTEAGGKAIAYKTDAWTALYTDRLNTVLGLLNGAKLPVIWLGQPVAREAGYSADMAYLNGIYETTVPVAGGDYLPLWDIIADESGNYAAYGKALDGETKRLRLDDGIHFTPAGYDIIVAKIKPEIDTLLAKLAAATPAAADPIRASAAPAPVSPGGTSVVVNSPAHS